MAAHDGGMVEIMKIYSDGIQNTASFHLLNIEKINVSSSSVFFWCKSGLLCIRKKTTGSYPVGDERVYSIDAKDRALAQRILLAFLHLQKLARDRKD